jgi:hypothetical protein
MPDTVIAIAKIGKKGVKYSLFSTAFASGRVKVHAAREITLASYGCRSSGNLSQIGNRPSQKKIENRIYFDKHPNAR